MFFKEYPDGVVVRTLDLADLPALWKMLPEENHMDFVARATIVALHDNAVAGCAQFILTLDNILHSCAIRVSEEFKGLGIGTKLFECKELIARERGAALHIYAIAMDGEVALKHIVTKAGMHLCMKRNDLLIYMKDLQS